MAGEAGIIVAENLGVRGVPGVLLAIGVSLPISVALGAATGAVMNAAKGREMVTGLILGFFANGVFQLVFLLLAGPVIPFGNKALLLSQGTGLRNMIDLEATGDALPRAAVFALTGALAIALLWLARTKLGQDLRAVGQDLHAARILGIDVERKRITAMVISTVLGGVGMVLYVVDIGTLNTYQSHEQVGFYAIAALLVGGASVERASVAQALVGTALFHALIPVLTQVGQERLGSPQVGEYLRELAAYVIIGATLAIHAVRKARERRHGDHDA
jgi:simple sugar transport system permease protein